MTQEIKKLFRFNKKKFMQWFLRKPKDIWLHACIAMFISRLLMYASFFMVFLQSGIVLPDMPLESMDSVFNNVSESIANAYSGAIKSVFISGQTIGSGNKIIAYTLYYILGGFIYSIWLVLVVSILNLIRISIGFILRRHKRLLQ